MFSVPVKPTYSDAEVAQVHMAFRSARAEVRAATTLSRAAFHRAVDLGIQSVVDRCLSTRPTEATEWERYTKAQEEMNQSTGIGHLLARAYTERQLNS